MDFFSSKVPVPFFPLKFSRLWTHLGLTVSTVFGHPCHNKSAAHSAILFSRIHMAGLCSPTSPSELMENFLLCQLRHSLASGLLTVIWLASFSRGVFFSSDGFLLFRFWGPPFIFSFSDQLLHTRRSLGTPHPPTRNHGRALTLRPLSLNLAYPKSRVFILAFPLWCRTILFFCARSCWHSFRFPWSFTRVQPRTSFLNPLFFLFSWPWIKHMDAYSLFSSPQSLERLVSGPLLSPAVQALHTSVRPPVLSSKKDSDAPSSVGETFPLSPLSPNINLAPSPSYLIFHPVWELVRPPLNAFSRSLTDRWLPGPPNFTSTG